MPETKRDVVLEINKAAYDTDYNVSITVNESIPIDINITRIIAVLIIMEVAYISKHYDLLDEKYDKRSFKHEIVLLCVLALAILALTYINVHCGVFDESTTYNEDYVKSILSGRTYLSHTPSKEFLELDNPYDAIDRGKLKRDKDYLWDTAYYNGHEYLYFGVLPALILFLPYYVITGKILSIYTGGIVYEGLHNGQSAKCCTFGSEIICTIWLNCSFLLSLTEISCSIFDKSINLCFVTYSLRL